MKTRGRPKGRSQDEKSYGPLGDLIRSSRLKGGHGLNEVAKACGCSVQFISNIEHGRAPLPWDKTEALAKFLKIPVADLQAANLCIRSDFKSFVQGGKTVKAGSAPKNFTNAATVLTMAARDSHLREIILRYQSASPAARTSFYRSAVRELKAGTEKRPN